MTSKFTQNDRTLIHLVEQQDTSGAVERYLLGKLEEVKLQPGCGHQHVVRLPVNTSELCVQRLITASPVPSRAASWNATVERSRALLKNHWYLWNVAAAINNCSLVFPFLECLFFISSGYRVGSTRQAPTRPRRSSCW